LLEQISPPVPDRAIGRALGLTGGAVKSHYTIYGVKQSAIGRRGRPSILAQEELEDVIAKILNSYERKCPMTVFQACDMIRDRWAKEMILDTFYHIAKRDQRTRACTAVPMENARMGITPEDIDRHFQYLRDTIDGPISSFATGQTRYTHCLHCSRRQLRASCCGEAAEDL
jgi:hypothetical protein